MRSGFHKSVLLKETIGFLQIKKGKRYIDATLGGGGHTERILELGGEVLGIDADQEAIIYVQNKLKNQNAKLKIIQGNFRNIDKLVKSEGLREVSGVLFDLGVSSFQIEDETRGFSFQKEAELDMRIDRTLGVKAFDLLNLLTERKLYEIFTEFGEEHRARAIASAVAFARKLKAIRTTGDLLKIIQGVYGLKGEISGKQRASIAKRVFQALRIAVNDELNSLKESLPKALMLLVSGGRIAVISFHSLEDRIVKDSFISFEKEGLGAVITKKPVIANKEEINENPRARSAKLRIFEKI